MRALFADRDARLLLVGQGLSLFGDRAMYIVLGVWVKSLTGSNAQAGLVFFVLAIPGVVAPAFGLLVDRVRKRPLMSELYAWAPLRRVRTSSHANASPTPTMNPMKAATMNELRRRTALTCRPLASLIICADSIESTAASAIWSAGSWAETSPYCWVDVARISPHDADAVALSMDERLELSIF